MKFIFAVLLALGLASSVHAQGITTSPASPAGSVSPMVLISTQNITAGASFQWTSLPTYLYYTMNCTDVTTSSNSATIYVEFGEGATPTWELTNYSYYNSYDFSGNNSGAAPLVFSSTSAAGIFVVNTSPPSGTGASLTMSLTLGNLSGSTFLHTVSGFSNLTYSTVGLNTGITVMGAYMGDTNAVTAVRLIPSTGTVTGKCSLYGISS